jgi:hypothetical protein
MEMKDADFTNGSTVDISARQRRAAERILENESIREGIDDSGASALLNWGVECAKRIVGDTADLDDEDEAEEASYPRMRALRQLLEDVKSLVRPELLPSEGETLLEEIIEFASAIYGPDAQLPEHINWDVVNNSSASDNGEKINGLRALLENNFASQGE